MNLFDYLDWRGDLTFLQDPFNEVDNLLLSYISYTVFDTDIFENNPSLTMQQCSNLFFQKHTVEEIHADKSFIAKAPLVLLKASKTNRFKNVVLHDYVSVLQQQPAIQFSALHFDLDEQTSYIAFRGTDNTIIGWKEDLLLSYQTIQAQVLAKDYLNRTIQKNRRYYIGGHSKGGNLALYGSCMCQEDLKEQFIQIYNNDGPALSDQMASQQQKDKTRLITQRIIPGFSVFGMIYDDDSYSTKVIRSNGKLIMQHDALTWQIQGNHFLTLDSVSNESQIIKQGLDDFIKQTTDQQKEVFINELCNAFYDANIHKVSQLSTEGMSGIVKMIKEISEINADAKLVGTKLLNVFKDCSFEEMNQFKENTSEYLKDKVSDVQNFLNDQMDQVNDFINEKVSDVSNFIDDTKSTLISKINRENKNHQ